MSRPVRPRPAPPPRDVSEKDWSRVVVEYARWHKWADYHPWLSIRSPRGWPDQAFCRPPRLVLAEIKTEKGKMTPSQELWRDLLKQCPGVEWYLWRPSDWDEVQEVLK